MKIVLATHNQDKCAEMKAILGHMNLSFVTLKDFPEIGEIIEDGNTLIENALIKARCVYNITKLPSIADDTGLSVDVLNGAPGIYSARFAGENCSYSDNVNKLLKEMENTPKNKRSAYFCTSIAYIDDKLELTTEGFVKGIITNVTKGIDGFGYDPVFYVPSIKKTYAEMSMDEKNKISHRGIAIRNMQKLLKSHLPKKIHNMEDLA
tara:strand:- start:1816 stop:2436 length:621 start_codon:yes stop_codon:yes gene_type:complete